MSRIHLGVTAALMCALVACAHSSSNDPAGPSGRCAAGTGADCGGDPPAPPPHQPTEIERRRDAACEALGPRLTDCAIADARATMSAKELADLDIERTAPIHTREFIKGCKEQALSSRQVRVYEVCLREETECAPLVACLDNAAPGAEP